MWKCFTALSVGAVVSLLVASPAWAKGPTGATIEGPGLDQPILIEGNGERGAGSDFSEFVEAAGFWQLIFGIGYPGELGTVMPEPASEDLGARYVVSWHIGDSLIPADVFLHAPEGPLVRVQPGQPVEGFGMETTGGWFAAQPLLLDVIAAYGVPVMKASAPAAPATVAVEMAPAEPPRAPLPQVATPAGQVWLGIPLAAGGIIGAVTLLWAVRRRPRRVGAS